SSQMSTTAPIPTPAAAPARLNKILNHETYKTDGIASASSLSPSPLLQFSTWFAEANDHPNITEPEAFALSTVDSTVPGRAIPSTRVVLLKEVDERGFVFYTNYESRKGKELFPDGGEKGAYASMAFYWHGNHRSVRIVGKVEKVSAAETEAYYHSRPIGSQVGAWASKQSKVLENREELEGQVKEIEKQFGVEGGKVKSFVDVGPGEGEKKEEGNEGLPVPPFWGGVRIVPFEVEFWMGRDSRLHDRFRYTREEGSEGEWEVVRLSP
ncbi:pyridoxamine 5'-phosphate oxidase, partial [Phenoliferia sp. Uapishka_3]